MILAGGAFSLTACGGGLNQTGPDGPLVGGGCGNASPDPCICGRPDANADAAAACDAQLACQAAGGTYIPYYASDSAGVTTPPHCVFDGGAGPDAAPTSDGSGSDGV
jgi:hypothetical protein